MILASSAPVRRGEIAISPGPQKRFIDVKPALT
jgi:hypothetical protein